MGYTTYSSVDRAVRATSVGYHDKPVTEVLNRKSLQLAMNPRGLTIRESRDSDIHPNSVPIIIGLDVTGSMLNVPAEMVRDGLPTIMTDIIQAGTPDPQILFLGIGDHECDSAPLQVSQFESGDAELDHWLTNIYLERGGGGNDGESYLLAWYVAAFKTVTDAFEKRNLKGFLFTIGDEKVLPSIGKDNLERIFGEGQYADYTRETLLLEAKKKYNVFHIHTKETGSGRRNDVMEDWKQLLGENLLIINDHSEIPSLISKTVLSLESKVLSESDDTTSEKTNSDNIDIID